MQFARDVAAHVSEDAQASIRGHWASVGRVAVSCGPAGCEGIKGIFTLNPAGKPVIWVPTTSAAAAHMGSLVAASAGCDSNEVPAGYQEVAPKVFEEMGGKGKTRNWQLSVAVIGKQQSGPAPATCVQNLMRCIEYVLAAGQGLPPRTTACCSAE